MLFFGRYIWLASRPWHIICICNLYYLRKIRMHKQSSTLSSRNHSMHWSKEMRSRTGIVFVSLYPTISICLLFFFNEPAVELPIIWISHAKTGVKTKNVHVQTKAYAHCNTHASYLSLVGPKFFLHPWSLQGVGLMAFSLCWKCSHPVYSTPPNILGLLTSCILGR